VSGDPRDLVNSEVREVRARSLDVLSRKAAKWREDPSRPSEKGRWQRSRDLATSKARGVKVQKLDALSREWRGHERIRAVHS
jgi:hypothetical protein